MHPVDFTIEICTILFLKKNASKISYSKDILFVMLVIYIFRLLSTFSGSS